MQAPANPPATMSATSITLALLPLENLTGAPEDTLLARGFAHDLIAELAQFPALGVIAADSAWAESREPDGGAGAAPAPQADYLLKGSVRRWGDTLRLNIQLLEASHGHHLWAGRYDSGNLLEIHDDIVAKVANALALQMDRSLLRTARRGRETPHEAYTCWLRGMECLQRGSADADLEGRRHFERALEFNPGDARALGGLSLSYFNDWSCQAWERWGDNEERAHAYAVQAEAQNPDDALVQLVLARLEQYRRHFERAGPRLHRAHALAPNDAHVLIHLALGFTLQGEAAAGWEFARRAIELNPLCPVWYYCLAMQPLFSLRRYEEALAMAAKAPPELIVDTPAYEAAAHACLGRKAEAAQCLEEFRADFKRRIAGQRESTPDELLRWILHVNPYRRPEDTAHLVEGLRRAGLEEVRSATPAPLPWPISNVFRRDGMLWTLAFERQVIQMPGLRGLEDIARLLACPGEEVPSFALAGTPVQAGGLEILDDQARQAYRNRLRELEADIDEANAAANVARCETLEAERDRLVQELQRGLGLGGRRRTTGDPAERARMAVTWRIRHAIRKIEALHPALARHLTHSIRTGVYCRYQPERETTWSV